MCLVVQFVSPSSGHRRMLEALKLHATILKTGLLNHAYRSNLLLRAYVQCGALSHARHLLLSMPSPAAASFNTLLSGYLCHRDVGEALDLFDAMPQTDARSWNTIISGLARAGRPDDAITRYVCMARSNVRPDDFTCSAVIACCGDLDVGRQIHATVVKVCSDSDVVIGTNLMKLYAEAGGMVDAEKLFVGMQERDLVAWNVMISCYSEFGMGESSIRLFQRMVGDGIGLDEFTLAIVLNELVSQLMVFGGMQVHSLILRSGFCSDRFACNALLNLYAKSAFIASAARLFDEILGRDVVTWTTLISGFAVSDHAGEAFEAFDRMRMSKIDPNSFNFGTLISCCASSNSFAKGKQYHALAKKYGLELDVIIGSSIIDMYSKCGEMDDASMMFQSLPVRDIVCWNGMICGFAQNGDATKALELFDEMVRLHRICATPNTVTFVGVLTACSHGGLVQKGCSFFNDMIHTYSINPQPEHYTCLADVFARAGLLEEAKAIILDSPFEPDPIAWGALLAACRRRGNLAMAKQISEQLVADDPRNSSNYVLLADIYAASGEWRDALSVREAMDKNGTQKAIGNSWIEVGGNVHCFAAGHGGQHPQLELITERLQSLWLLLLEEGYQCNVAE